MSDDVSADTQLRLDESEERYRAVIENASDMIQSVRPDGTFEFVNDAWKNALGYADKDLESMTLFEVIDPEYMDHCMAEFMRTLNGEKVDFLETRFLTNDGRKIPVEGSITARFLGDEVVATHGFFRDITERLHARELEERAVRLEIEERARYQEKMAALGKLSAGLAHELNNPTAAMQRAGAILTDTFHRRDDSMLRLASASLDIEAWRTMEEVLSRAQPDKWDPLALSELESDIEQWLEDHGVERAWELAPGSAEAGITVRDLQALSDRLPATSFAEGIAWINDSLTLRESTEIIADCCKRIAGLVEAIKGYSHMDGAEVYEADIQDGIDNTLSILKHRLKSISVDLQVDSDIPAIRMYGNSLNQVWTNIIDNAIDALDGEGEIAIRTTLDDGHVVVEIEDDGPGIPSDALPRIFEPFFTLKPQGEGTGLGLDTAWRIITGEYSGSMDAESRPGQTIFRVRLPLDAPPPAQYTQV